MSVTKKEQELAQAKHRKQKLRKDDEVVVIAGKEKGKRGKVLFIDKKKDRVFVEGVNKRKRFQRPTQENPRGGQVELEAGMHISNVMFYDSKTKKGVRIGFQTAKDGQKARVTRPEGREV